VTEISFGPPDIRLAYAWIRSSYWATNIPWERFREACENSLVFAAFEGGVQIGFARVVTDQATFAWLCDVFVAERARGRGVGLLLLQHVLADPRLGGLRQILLATKDAHGLYAKLGFEPIGGPGGRWMGIVHAAADLYPAGSERAETES
jgi:GNAT superfamily N-acetyltransferase